MKCCCPGPCDCGCAPPTNSSSGGGGTGTGGTGGSGGGGGDNPVNQDGTRCVDPGIIARGIPAVIDEDFCTRRTRIWRGRDVSGNPVTDASQPAKPAIWSQDSDGLAGWTDQPCVDLPNLEVFQYGAFVDSIMGRKDGCEFDVVGKPGAPGVGYWDGSKFFFTPPDQIGIEPVTCATLGSPLTLVDSLVGYTATISAGMEKLAVNLTVNVGPYAMVVTGILNQPAGIISLDLVEPLPVPVASLPAGTDVCPVGFVSDNILLPFVTPAEMQTGPKIILQLPNKKLRRMPDPDDSIGTPVLAFDKTNKGAKWVNLTTSPGSAQTISYPFDGIQHVVTIPAWAVKLRFFIWGGGGSTDNVAYGGAGGYVTGFLNVVGGDIFSVITGDGGGTIPGVRAFGGGGAMSPYPGHQGAGGGFSGLFTGAAAIVGTDNARAVAIAGGGGSGSATAPNTNIIYGGGGGAPGAGGQPTMQGVDATGTQFSGTGAGGGGYTGGGNRGMAGWGGESYLKAGVVLDGQKLSALDADPTPQLSSSPYYVTGVARAGLQGQNNTHGGAGLVVLEFS